MEKKKDNKKTNTKSTTKTKIVAKKTTPQKKVTKKATPTKATTAKKTTQKSKPVAKATTKKTTTSKVKTPKATAAKKATPKATTSKPTKATKTTKATVGKSASKTSKTVEKKVVDKKVASKTTAKEKTKEVKAKEVKTKEVKKEEIKKQEEIKQKPKVRKLIIGNWKMNIGPAESIKFINKLLTSIQGKELSSEWAIAAPFLSLPYLLGQSYDQRVNLAAQNIHTEAKGAYTGEVSVLMLEQLGVKYVILGHSERRKHFNETNEIVNKKVLRTLKSDVNPVMAFGETEEQRKKGTTKRVVKKQIKEGLRGVPGRNIGRVILAYEPVWAIGTGKNATPKDAQEICKFARDVVKELYGEAKAKKVKILYGGSVTPKNVKSLLTQPDIDGGLVGGASLDPQSFIKLINYDK